MQVVVDPEQPVAKDQALRRGEGCARSTRRCFDLSATRLVTDIRDPSAKLSGVRLSIVGGGHA